MLELNYGEPGKRLNPARIAAWLADADAHRPFMIEPTRWLRFLADARRFVAAGWIEKAGAQGWLDLDLFGVDPQTPLDNPDDGRTGLVPMLNGRTLVALNRDWAVIRNLADENCVMHSRQLQFQSRFHRQKPLVCVWQLPISAPPAPVEN
jgi:hypothetical protein